MSRNRKYSTVIIDGVDYWQYFKFPLLLQKSLDESLDFATFELHNTSRKEPFKPFTPVTVGEGESALSYVVASDEVEEVFGANRYKHTVTVMEKTKETERIMCGAKAFTNPLVRDYTDGETAAVGFYVTPYVGNPDFFTITEETLNDPILASVTRTPVVNDGLLEIYADFNIPNMNQADNYDVDVYYSASDNLLKELDKNGNETGGFEIIGQKIWSKTVPTNSMGKIGDVDITNYGQGQYFIMYRTSMALGMYVATEIYVSDEKIEKPVYTVEAVVNHLLDTAETLRQGIDEPRYRLKVKDEQRARFQQDAPEFRFSNGRSLWENLREVGQFIHAIPRAVHNLADGKDYIVFDDLGGTVSADLSKGVRYSGGSSLSVGDYTAGLEAMATNLVNLDDIADGSITEPFDGGYQSLRAATEVARITEDTGIIKTTHPIEKVINVEVSVTVSGKTYTGDITPYVFAKTEYDVLSSFSGMYPTSKTYALYYNQGAANIEGLWYKAQDAATSAGNAAKQYSITNVVAVACGAPVGVLKGMEYNNLLFRVTYVPSVTARVRQYNPVFDGDFPAMLAHNQSANKLSAKAFGENLRGQLAMMSKADEVVQYRFPRVEDLPEPGTLYDNDRYISSVTARVYHDFVLAQLNLSAGYNEMGARVEINNAIRQFEIPAAEDRYTTLEEFVVIGKKETDDANLAMKDGMKSAILGAFEGYKVAKDVTLAMVTTKDDDGNAITVPPVALPVVSLAIGTSLYFGFRFESNFAAGSKSTGSGALRFQDYVPYGDDFYSHAETVGFKLTANASVTGNALTSAHALPESSGISGGTVMVDTGDHPILWHKDSADAGRLAYQVHYMTNDGLIVGDGLAYHCPAVRKTPAEGRARVYFFPHRINQLTGTTDISDAMGEADAFGFKGTEIEVNGYRIKGVTAPIGAVSWAIIKGGRFLLGKNSTRMDDIYFNFKRRLT